MNNFKPTLKSNPTRRILVWLPAMVMAAAIFAFSAQPAEVSTETSDMVTRVLLRVGQSLNIFQIAEADMLEICELLSTPVRKTAHVTEYAVFYGTLLFALFHEGVRGPRWPKLALLLTVLYACTDEFHQLFVPGRAGQFTDVLIDSLGAALITAILLLRNRRADRET